MTTRWISLCLLVLVLALTGCSGMRIIDSDVRTYTTAQSVSVPATYRFELLPSQQALPAQGFALQDMVQAELDKVGMHRDDTAPQYSVRFDLRVQQDARSPWSDPGYGAGFPFAYPVVTPHGVVYHYRAPLFMMEMPWYRREVSLVIRRLSDGALVYESNARSDGYWADDEAVLPAMFEAALRDFPNPPQGLRRVLIEIPR